MLQRGLNHLRAAIALGDHLIELAAAGGDQLELRSHKETVQRDESKDGKQAARRRGHGRGFGRLRSNKYKEHMGVIYIVVET